MALSTSIAECGEGGGESLARRGRGKRYRKRASERAMRSGHCVGEPCGRGSALNRYKRHPRSGASGKGSEGVAARVD